MKEKAKKVFFTGGGSAGHVIPNLAIINRLKQEDWQIEYIGSHEGIERQLIAKEKDIPYHPIATGKLRRYFDWKNVKDPFRVIQGVWQAYRLFKRHKPNLLFSKGGFVSVPVIIGAKLNGIPTIIHESDYTPGLANKIAAPFASKILTTFGETLNYIKNNKGEHIGAIVRDELKEGKPWRGLQHCRFTQEKPIALFIGGSLGAQKINEVLRAGLDQVLPHFQVVHICGQGKVDETVQKAGYLQYEYVQEELPDLLAMADIIVSRAGSNVIYEFLTLKKPMLLIPLSKAASRGDQILNAYSFEKRGFAHVIEEENLTTESLLEQMQALYHNRDAIHSKMAAAEESNALDRVVQIIKDTVRT